MKQRILSMLVLLAAVVSGAWAQVETLLTTITATAKEQASYSTANVATVSFSNLPSTGGNTYGSDYLANWGWWGYGWSATVNAAEGYTITKCIFYDDANRPATDSEAPFVVETTEEDKTPRVNGTPIKADTSKGIKKIEVYGYVTPTYSVTLAEGTEEGDKWTVKVGEGEAQAFPVEGLNGGETVTATYSGEKKVKSVKAVKKAAASFTEVTTFNELQTELSAGKNVKLMNDIECTEGIGITSNGVTIDGNGKKLTLNKGISLASGATLTFQGNGTMVVNGTNKSTASTVAGSTGTLILTSGTLTATGGKGEDVDEDWMNADVRAYAGGNAINGNVTVSGGTLTAIGGNGGSIGDYSSNSYGADGGVAISGSVTVTDGTVTATGGNGGSIGADASGANGGSGGAAIGGNATVNGGTWTATNGTNGGGGGGAGGKAVAGTVTDNR